MNHAGIQFSYTPEKKDPKTCEVTPATFSCTKAVQDICEILGKKCPLLENSFPSKGTQCVYVSANDANKTT